MAQQLKTSTGPVVTSYGINDDLGDIGRDTALLMDNGRFSLKNDLLVDDIMSCLSSDNWDS